MYCNISLSLLHIIRYKTIFDSLIISIILDLILQQNKLCKADVSSFSFAGSDDSNVQFNPQPVAGSSEASDSQFIISTSKEDTKIKKQKGKGKTKSKKGNISLKSQNSKNSKSREVKRKRRVRKKIVKTKTKRAKVLASSEDGINSISKKITKKQKGGIDKTNLKEIDVSYLSKMSIGIRPVKKGKKNKNGRNLEESIETWHTISMSDDISKKLDQKKELKTKIQPTTRNPRFNVIPSLVVFKADYIFWPFRVETDIIGPFGLRIMTPEATSKPGLIIGDFGGRELIDIKGTLMKVYEHAEIVLRTLHKKGIKLGVMERTGLGGKVIHLVKLLELDVIDFWEVNEDPELDQIKRIRRKAGVDFRDIVYVGINDTILKQIKELGTIVLKLKRDDGLQLKHMGEIIHKFAIRPPINISPTETCDASSYSVESFKSNETYNIDELMKEFGPKA
uniref:Uncharacterized protein n=1 Tax=Clastoptera arizonana TaxID=38151 RepID=A0A1B6CDV0_9HEMI